MGICAVKRKLQHITYLFSFDGVPDRSRTLHPSSFQLIDAFLELLFVIASSCLAVFSWISSTLKYCSLSARYDVWKDEKVGRYMIWGIWCLSELGNVLLDPKLMYKPWSLIENLGCVEKT